MKYDKFEDLTLDQKLEFYRIANNYYQSLLDYQNGELSKSEFIKVIADTSKKLDQIERRESLWKCLKSLFQFSQH